MRHLPQKQPPSGMLRGKSRKVVSEVESVVRRLRDKDGLYFAGALERK